MLYAMVNMRYVFMYVDSNVTIFIILIPNDDDDVDKISNMNILVNIYSNLDLKASINYVITETKIVIIKLKFIIIITCMPQICLIG